MHVHATLQAPCPPDMLFGWVDDLERYPSWLDLIRSAEPAGVDAWVVVLSTRVGPLRRSKRLRMVRTTLDAAGASRRARFERSEVDGRDHAAWVLEATVRAVADRPDPVSELAMDLRYSGRLWGPMVERVLREQIDAARPRLAALATA